MVRRRVSTTVRQKQIVDAARKVIIKYGSEHVTIKRIAKEVGVSEAGLYRHFKSKKEILSLLAENTGQVLLKDFLTEVEGQTPLKILENVLESHLSEIEQRRGIIFQVIAEIISLGDKKLNASILSSIDQYITRVHNLLAEAVKSGEIRDDVDLQATATIIFSLIQGLTNIWTLNNYNFSLQERYASLWAVFRKSIQN